MRSGKNGSTLLTEGSILGKLFGFAVPLFLGNLFQQLYNTCDSLIVGNFVGSEALAGGQLLRQPDFFAGGPV